jgi:ribosome-associated protein
VLVDLGAVIVHVMQPAIRQYYNLEEIWGSSQPKPRKTAARKTPAVKAPAGKTASRAAK